MMLVTFCLSWIWPTGTIPDTSVVHQQQKFAVCVRSSDQGDVNCCSIIFSLTAVLMLGGGGGPFKFNPPHPPLLLKTKQRQTISAEQWRDSVSLPDNQWIWIWLLAHLAECDSCLAGGQLEPISYEHSLYINLVFGLQPESPPPSPFLPTRSLKGIKSIDFVVIIIAFINRGYKTEQSPLEVVSPQGQVGLMAFLNMAECI